MDVLRRVKIELDTSQPKRALEELERGEREVSQESNRLANNLEAVEQSGRGVAQQAGQQAGALGNVASAAAREAQALGAAAQQQTANAASTRAGTEAASAQAKALKEQETSSRRMADAAKNQERSAERLLQEERRLTQQKQAELVALRQGPAAMAAARAERLAEDRAIRTGLPLHRGLIDQLRAEITTRDRLQREIDETTRKRREESREAQRGPSRSGTFDQFTAGFSGVGSQLAGLAAGLFTVQAAINVAQQGLQQLAAGAQRFREFEAGLTGVGKTADLSGDALAELGQEIQKLAERRDIATPVKDLLAIAEAAGSMGITGSKNILLFTEVVAKLGRTSDLAGEEGAAGLATILGVAQEAPDKIEQLASVVVKLGGDMKATEKQIVHMASEVIRATAVYDVTSTEAAGLAAAMVSMGQRAELAGSVVGETFLMLEKAVRGVGEDGQAAMEALTASTGVSAARFREAWENGPIEAFDLYLQALHKIDTQGGSVPLVLEEVGLKGNQVNKVLPAMAKNYADVAAAMRMAASEQTLAEQGLRDQLAINIEAARSAETLDSHLVALEGTWTRVSGGMGRGMSPAIVQISDDWSRSLSENARNLESVGTAAGAVAIAVATLGRRLSEDFSKGLSLATFGVFNFLNARRAAEEEDRQQAATRRQINEDLKALNASYVVAANGVIRLRDATKTLTADQVAASRAALEVKETQRKAAEDRAAKELEKVAENRLLPGLPAEALKRRHEAQQVHLKAARAAAEEERKLRLEIEQQATAISLNEQATKKRSAAEAEAARIAGEKLRKETEARILAQAAAEEAAKEAKSRAKAEANLAEQIQKRLASAEVEARQTRELAALAASDEAGRRRLAASHQVENALRASGIKLSEQEIRTLVEGGKVASDLANQLRDSTKAKIEAAEASDRAKKAYEVEQAVQRDLAELLAEVATAQQKANEARKPEATATQKAAGEAANLLLQAQFKLISEGIGLWSKLGIQYQAAAVALGRFNAEAARTKPPSVNDALGKLGFEDPSSPDFSARPDYNPWTGVTRSSEEAAKEASEAWRREFAVSWEQVADIGVNVFEEWLRTGEVSVRSIAEEFLSIWTNAFREWLQRWLAHLARAQAAQQAANLGNVSAGGGFDATGLTSGAGTAGAAGAGGGWGAAAAALWPAAVIAAIYVIADNYIERKKSRRFGASTEFEISGGKNSGLALSEAGIEITRTIAQVVRDFQYMTGSIVTEMDRLGVQIRADGDSIRVTLAGTLVGTFDEMGEALAYGIQDALRNADIEGLSAEVAQLIRNNQFSTIEEFQNAVSTVQGVLDSGLSDAERQARAFSNEISELVRQFTEWGISTASIADMAQRNAQSWRDQILGIQRSEQEMRELERQAYNRWVAMERARAQAEIDRLRQLQARGTTPTPGAGPRGGPTGPANRGPSGGAFEAVRDGLWGLEDTLFDFGRAVGNTGFQVAAAAAVAAGSQDDYAAAIKAWEEYLASLREISEEELAEGERRRRRGGGGGGRNRQEELADFRERLQEIMERGMSEPARALAEMNREITRLHEEGRKAGATAAELAAAERALREERGKAMRESIRPWTTDFGKSDFERRLEEERRRVDELRAIPLRDRLANGGPGNRELNTADRNITAAFAQELRESIASFGGLGESLSRIRFQADELRRGVQALGLGAEETAKLLAEIDAGAAYQVQQAQFGILDRLFGYLENQEGYAQRIAEHERAKLELQFRLIEAQLRAFEMWDEATQKIFSDAHDAAVKGLADGSRSQGGAGASIADEASRRQEEAARKFDDAVRRFTETTKSLQDFQRSLRLDEELTHLSPREQVAEARRRFEEIAAKARGGDQAAREQVEKAARDFLGEYGDTFGRGAAFAEESRSIDRLLTELIGQTRFTLDGVTFDARLGFQEAAKEVERIVRFGFGALADAGRQAGDDIKDAADELGKIKGAGDRMMDVAKVQKDAADRFREAVDKFSEEVSKGTGKQVDVPGNRRPSLPDREPQPSTRAGVQVPGVFRPGDPLGGGVVPFRPLSIPPNALLPGTQPAQRDGNAPVRVDVGTAPAIEERLRAVERLLQQVGSDAAARQVREDARDGEQRATEAKMVELLDEMAKALRMTLQRVA